MWWGLGQRTGCWRRRGRFQPRAPDSFVSQGLQASPAECHMPADESQSKRAWTWEGRVWSLSSPMAAVTELLHELFLMSSVTQSAQCSWDLFSSDWEAVPAHPSCVIVRHAQTYYLLSSHSPCHLCWQAPHP